MAMVGAVAGAVGTVASVGGQMSQQRQQRRQLNAQHEHLSEQHKLLIQQRTNQREVSEAEAARARKMESLASTANLFNVALQEQALGSQQIAEQLQLRAAEAQNTEQALAATTQAYGEQMGVYNELFQVAEQAAAVQGEVGVAASELEGAQATSGQTDTASAAAGAERLALDSQEAMNQANQLFEMMSAQADQGLNQAEDVIALQQQLGMNDIDLARMMSQFNNASGLMQLEATRDATNLESQMNNAAIDEELAARQQSITAAQNAESLNIQGAQQVNRIQSSGSGGGLFSMAPALAQAGLGVYNAFNPTSASPRITNPYSGAGGGTQSTLQTTSFGGPNLSGLPRFGSNSYTMPAPSRSGNTNSLFNIG